jgi:oxygen-dependent protoporphyrinogen oxidase
MPRILVVGGGISGLTSAFRLQQLLPIVDVQVWESGSRLGGAIWSEQHDGFTIEHGPNGFLDNKPALWNLAHDLGLGDRLIPASEAARQHRFLFLHRQLQRLPGNIPALISSPLLSWSGKLRLLIEPLIHRGRRRPESVADFAARRFGREAADVFIDPLVTGIHGGDPALLDVRSAFPRLSEWEQSHGSILRGVFRLQKDKRLAARSPGTKAAPQRMWSFPNGLREMIDALAEKLTRPPICRRSATSLHVRDRRWVIDNESFHAVILACPAYVQAKLLSPVDDQLAKLVADIPYTPIAVVALGFRMADLPNRPVGFGFIAPQRTRRDILGVQWCSDIYPNRAPAGLVLWRALCGGWNRPEIVNWPDDQLIEAVRRELRLAQGVTAAPVMTQIIRWPRAIPQYTLGHPERLQAISARQSRLPGLFLAGNAYRGIALNDCVEDAGRVAQAVIDYINWDSAV